MTLAVSSAQSSKDKTILVRNQHQDVPNIHIPTHSNPQRAITSSSSTGVSPTSSSSSSSATVGSSSSGILQPYLHSQNYSTGNQCRDYNEMIDSDAGAGSTSTNNVRNNVITNDNFNAIAAASTTTTLGQLVAASSSQKIMVHQQEHDPSMTTTVLSAFSGNSSHVAANNQSATQMQFVLSNTTSLSSSACCNETVTTTINSNCSKEKIISGKNNLVKHHPLRTPSKNTGSYTHIAESNKGPAPQPPILHQPRPKMVLFNQRSLDYNGAELNNDCKFEFSSNAIIKQPAR